MIQSIAAKAVRSGDRITLNYNFTPVVKWARPVGQVIQIRVESFMGGELTLIYPPEQLVTVRRTSA